MHSDAFDVIPYEDIKGDWKKLGSGSFGNVYKGIYLGIDVAIKEVLPSTEYDVGKYFEREWRLMKECRHPNICLFIGLSRAPPPDNRIFIISEFIENGNVRTYIHDKSKPFPWRLRLSFATDTARALAYLHARKCIHRDLKGENLLITANGRLKITDFGFARIAARNEEESKRLTFCGTDSYMSPEILLGDEFDLPTDVFSLGIIFCEIAARKLADDTAFKRYPPEFGINAEEVRRRASAGCPEEFIQLCLDCLNTDPTKRPGTRDILERLRLIEAAVLLRPSEGDDTHVGSVKFMTGGKRPAAGPRIPSFGMGVGKDIRGATASDESDDELMEAVLGLSSVGASSSHWTDSTDSQQPLLNGKNGTSSEYSTTVIRGHSQQGTTTVPPSLSSILTIRPSPDPNEVTSPVLPATPLSGSSETTSASSLVQKPEHARAETYDDPLGTSSILSIASIDSYHTVPSDSIISSALATEGGSAIHSVHTVEGNYVTPLVHRFTLLKPGAKPKKNSISGSGSASPNGKEHFGMAEGAGWNPLDLFFSSGLLVAKCDVCTKRLGWKPVLECDDCGLRTHVKCGEIAPRDCGLRPSRPGFHQSFNSGSPVSKVKQELAKQPKSQSPARR
ncbi:TKL/LISK/LISK-DD1 protein kinase [Crucibulum laeve]|uniref:TKL/LISK/LISK-DD1 protein kinase n=1 Tax=Crucibulum laeve TaxID=68775 RepID=A0A5C3M9N0_9AGAR|nr:TKL/LISK/LISK-DD1 protein kinase [Crucibulum laeve]